MLYPVISVVAITLGITDQPPLCMTATSVTTDSDAVSHSGAITHFITDFILTMTATSATIHSNALGQYRQSFLEMTLLTPPAN
jgi:hypothetical protein